MENKKSSVDWLLDELLKNGYIKRLPVIEFQQAKAMHKEEIIEACFYGITIYKNDPITPIEYYNETFGGKQ